MLVSAATELAGAVILTRLLEVFTVPPTFGTTIVSPSQSWANADWPTNRAAPNTNLNMCLESVMHSFSN